MYFANAVLIYASLSIVIALLWFDHVMVSRILAVGILVSPVIVVAIFEAVPLSFLDFSTQKIVVGLSLFLVCLLCHAGLSFAVNTLKSQR